MGKSLINRFFWFAWRKHDVIECVAVVPHAKLGPQAISQWGRRVERRFGWRKRRKRSKDSADFFFKEFLVLARLYGTIVHGEY